MSFETSIPDRIMSEETVLKWIRLWHVQGKKVVFTNGCFDLLHRGHVEYLLKAADMGDKLIIGLNSDASVKLLNKGADRPLQDEGARALILASLMFVSGVVLFEDETPQKLIESLTPDILVKGGDYKTDQIVGADFTIQHGGSVVTIPLVEGYSTTAIENRIKSS
jgi:rfaE bifunctional protein nucleotidyltransferase chain/domain